jgi:uncharacterized protein
MPAMTKKTLLLLALAAACSFAQAQSTPAKKDLVAKILKLQQSGIEQMAREIAQHPANQLLANAAAALQARVPPAKQEAVARGIQQDAKKYADEALPLVRDRAIKLAPTTVGALLEEKFTEEELKQVVAMMESPVYLKFQQMGGEMQKVLAEKLVEDTRTSIEPKLRALDHAIGKRFETAQGPANAPAAAAPAAKASAKK